MCTTFKNSLPKRNAKSDMPPNRACIRKGAYFASTTVLVAIFNVTISEQKVKVGDAYWTPPATRCLPEISVAAA